MDRYIFVALGIIIGIVLTITAGGVGVWLSDIESPQDAYERGKVDGQLLEIRLQGDLAQKTIDLLIDCIHLIGYTELSLMALDSSDTFYLMMGLYDKDSLLIRTWGQRITVGFLDPTDTMPAVERESILPIILWDTGGVR